MGMASIHSVAEIEYLRRAAASFHSEPPHCKQRKLIIQKTLRDLKEMRIGQEYWTIQRVRTWFFNHNPASPRNKEQLAKRSLSPSSVAKEVNHSTSASDTMKTDSSPNSNPPKSDKKEIANIPGSLSDDESMEENSNPRSASPSPVRLKTRRSKRNSAQTKDKVFPKQTIKVDKHTRLPKEIHPDDLHYPFHKTWKLISCCSLLENKEFENERWLNESTGRISFNCSSISGRLNWVHDEYNSAKGKLIIGIRRPNPAWSEYLLQGTIAPLQMKELGYPQHERRNFKLLIRRIVGDEVSECNQELNNARKKDILKFGKDQTNSQAQYELLKLQQNDIEVKIYYQNKKGNEYGVRVFGRRLDLAAETFFWRPVDPKELRLAIHVMVAKISVLSTPVEATIEEEGEETTSPVVISPLQTAVELSMSEE